MNLTSKLLVNSIAQLDRAALLWIRPYQVRWATAFFRVLTYSGAGSSWFVTGGILSILQYLKIELLPSQPQFLNAMLAALTSWITGGWIKKWVNRKRPTEVINGYNALVSVPPCQSFPSSHASSAVSFFTALLLLRHEWASGVGLWAFLISFSRLYLGVHFPSDLVGGAIFGAGIGAVFGLLLLV